MSAGLLQQIVRLMVDQVKMLPHNLGQQHHHPILELMNDFTWAWALSGHDALRSARQLAVAHCQPTERCQPETQSPTEASADDPGGPAEEVKIAEVLQV